MFGQAELTGCPFMSSVEKHWVVDTPPCQIEKAFHVNIFPHETDSAKMCQLFLTAMPKGTGNFKCEENPHDRHYCTKKNCLLKCNRQCNKH